MKLWKISQDLNLDYDAFESAIVAAKDENAAIRVSPSMFYEWKKTDTNEGWAFLYADGKWKFERHITWVNDIDNVVVEYIGEAAPGIEAGLIMSSR